MDINSGYDNEFNTISLGNGDGDSVNVSVSALFNTITLGNGAQDSVVLEDFGHDTVSVGNGNGDTADIYSGNNTITFGNGNGDAVDIVAGNSDNITLGNGNGDVVNDFGLGQLTTGNTITVGNGNDTIYVGNSDTITVGAGHDSFIFEQTTPGDIGAVTINHFQPSLDVITLFSQMTAAVSYQDNAQGNAVITVGNAGDTVTLLGVHSSALQASNFRFV